MPFESPHSLHRFYLRVGEVREEEEGEGERVVEEETEARVKQTQRFERSKARGTINSKKNINKNHYDRTEEVLEK